MSRRPATLEYADSPLTYAARLAKYISDPSTIRARTIDHWGRAPSKEKCASLRADALRERERFREACDARMKLLPGREVPDVFNCGHERSLENTGHVGNNEACRECLAKKQDKVRLAYERKKTPPVEPWQETVDAVAETPPEAAAAQITHPYRRIVARAAELSGIPATVIVSRKRSAAVVAARWAVLHVLNGKGLGSSRAGSFVGIKDHTTVLYALGMIPDRRARDPEFDWLCDELEAWASVKPVLRAVA